MKRRGEVQPPRADAPEIDLPEDFWEKAEPVEDRSKTSVHLRVDADVLDFFKAQGKGHLTRMNKVLRSYVDTMRKHGGPR